MTPLHTILCTPFCSKNETSIFLPLSLFSFHLSKIIKTTTIHLFPFYYTRTCRFWLEKSWTKWRVSSFFANGILVYNFVDCIGERKTQKKNSRKGRNVSHSNFFFSIFFCYNNIKDFLWFPSLLAFIYNSQSTENKGTRYWWLVRKIYIDGIHECQLIILT